MAGKSSQSNNRGSDLFGYFASGKHLEYHTAKGANSGAAPSGIQASGGSINDYTVGSDVYRTHIFTSSATFEVTSLSTDDNLPNTIEYLVVAGGGGGGGESSQSGGGGGGGFRTNIVGHPVKAADFTLEVGTYTVTVGAGGIGGYGPNPGASQCGQAGSRSEFFLNGESYPSVKRVRSDGGGGGQGYGLAPVPQMNGGSGGGAICSPTAYSGGTGNPVDPNHPQIQGYAGGDCTPEYGGPYAGGGGGGAGRLGAPDDPATPLGRSSGGFGLQALISGPPANPQPIGAPGPGSGAAGTGYFSGGGGGGSYGSTGGTGGYGGGTDGAGGTDGNAEHAALSTGGGGGGSGHDGGYKRGGNGGSGVVMVRYKISSSSVPGVVRATGGIVSHYNNKTIHTFNGNGTFETTVNWNAGTNEVEYVCVGGGGGGGGTDPNCWGAGGGGAGQMRTGTTTISHPSPVAISIGAGGRGNVKYNALTATNGSNTTVAFPAGTVTGYGGGYGGSNSPSAESNGNPGTNHPNTSVGSGSGGGANKATPSTAGQGGPALLGANPGGSMPGGNHYCGAGGGGAGGAGGRGSDAPNVRSEAQILTDGLGGVGLQVPTTFQNPAVVYDGVHADAKWYLAGGGGGGLFNPNPKINPDRGGKGGGGRGGGGEPGIPGSMGHAGQTNTGGGGGGAGSFNDDTLFTGGFGGSGVVLIAYPS